MKKLLDILMLLIPFVDFIYDIHIENHPDFRFTYIIYGTYFFTYIKTFFSQIFTKKFFLEFKLFFIVLFFIIILSLYNIYADNCTLILFIKQILIVCFIASTSFIFIYNNRNNLNYIVDLYMKISLVFAGIAIFQEIFFLIGIEYLYNFSYLTLNQQQIGKSGFMLRATSICLEPPMLAFALIPATYISLNCLFTEKCEIISKWKAIVIITANIITYSAIGFCSILLSVFLLLLLNFKSIKIKRVVLLFVLYIFLFFLGGSGIVMRITDTSYLIKNDISKIQLRESAVKSKKLTKINQSSYLIKLHLKRTIDDFYQNPILGKGLGAYTYIKNSIKLKKYALKDVDLRLDGSTSLIFKIIVEFGVLGIIILFIVLCKYYIWNFKYSNKKLYYLVVINNATIIYILFILIRMPYYFCNGLWIFVWLYVFSKQKFLEEQKKKLLLNFHNQY